MPENVTKKLDEVVQILSSEDAVTNFTQEMSRFVIPGMTMDVKNPDVGKFLISETIKVLQEVRELLLEQMQEQQTFPVPH